MAHQSFTLVDQEPQIELGPVQLRGGEALQALRQRGAGDVERVDRIGLAALARAPAGLRGQVPRDPQHPLAKPDENRSSDPETCRQSSSAHTRCSSTPRAYSNYIPNPRRPTRTVRSPSGSPVPATIAAIVCERL